MSADPPRHQIPSAGVGEVAAAGTERVPDVHGPLGPHRGTSRPGASRVMAFTGGEHRRRRLLGREERAVAEASATTAIAPDATRSSSTCAVAAGESANHVPPLPATRSSTDFVLGLTRRERPVPSHPWRERARRARGGIHRAACGCPLDGLQRPRRPARGRRGRGRQAIRGGGPHRRAPKGQLDPCATAGARPATSGNGSGWNGGQGERPTGLIVSAVVPAQPNQPSSSDAGPSRRFAAARRSTASQGRKCPSRSSVAASAPASSSERAGSSRVVVRTSASAPRLRVARMHRRCMPAHRAWDGDK